MRKNILILGHGYATQFIDVYNQYTRLFDPKEYEVTTAYLTGVPKEEVRKRTLSEQVEFLNLSKKSIRGLKIIPIKKLLALTREKNFQIVICHRYKPAYIMMIVALLHPIPVLINVLHELKTMKSLARRVLIAVLNRVNTIFAGVSNAVRDDLRNSLWRIPQDRIITLYNTIDVELTEPQLHEREQARQLLQLPQDAFIFGNVARLAPNKDQKSLIQAFAQIKPDCPNAKLVLLGNGMLEQHLKEQVNALGLTNDVIFTGYVKEGFRYMKAFDGFVLSSVQEAFGRVLLEAMIARVPIIATSANGIPEVVGDAGVIVQPRDVITLAASMKALYQTTSAERERLAANAYQHMLANFSIPSFYKQFWSHPLTSAVKE